MATVNSIVESIKGHQDTINLMHEIRIYGFDELRNDIVKTTKQIIKKEEVDLQNI